MGHQGGLRELRPGEDRAIRAAGWNRRRARDHVLRGAQLPRDQVTNVALQCDSCGKGPGGATLPSRHDDLRHGLASAGWQGGPPICAYERLGQGFRPGLYADSGIWKGSGPLRTKVVVQTKCPAAIARTGLKGTSMKGSPPAGWFGVETLFSNMAT